MADFVVGRQREGLPPRRRELGPRPARAALVADIRSIVEGDPSPDGKGTLSIARGIEVGHVFNLGRKYAEAMKATVLDAEGKAQVMTMGCYGIGVSRIVAASIEQNSDANGIIWPEPMAPWRVAVCILNPKNEPKVVEAAEELYEKLLDLGVEACLDDRGMRPGPMLADIELIGIPHRVVVSERGLAAGSFEYRARRETENRQLSEVELLAAVRLNPGAQAARG
jgi:prolyl-tRNA synthetase